MVECTNFSLDEDDCKRCKEYPCYIVRNRNLWDVVIEEWGNSTVEMPDWGIILEHHTYREIKNYIQSIIRHEIVDDYKYDCKKVISVIRIPISIKGVEYKLDKDVIKKHHLNVTEKDGYHDIQSNDNYIEAKAVKFGVMEVVPTDIATEDVIDYIIKGNEIKHINTIIKFEKDGYYTGKLCEYIYDDD